MDRVSLLDHPDKAIQLTADHLSQGHLVIFPTDTVYILAVDATIPSAVTKLLNFKDRWPGKAISVAVRDLDMAKTYVSLIPSQLTTVSRLLPGPFTVVAPGQHLTAPGIEAENGTLGIRIPDNVHTRALSQIFPRPYTATSANLSGRHPHYSIESFLHTLSQRKLEQIDLLVDAGQLPPNLPSTVVDISGDSLTTLRRGDILPTSSDTYISQSEADTAKLSSYIFQKIISHPDFDPAKSLAFLLTGDLGCGKTVFTRGLASYLDPNLQVTSPTFNILHQHALSHPHFSRFLHFDLYRLSQDQDFADIHFFDQLTPGTLASIEWPEKMSPSLLSQLRQQVQTVTLVFDYLDAHTRQIKFDLQQLH